MDRCEGGVLSESGGGWLDWFLWCGWVLLGSLDTLDGLAVAQDVELQHSAAAVQYGKRDAVYRMLKLFLKKGKKSRKPSVGVSPSTGQRSSGPSA